MSDKVSFKIINRLAIPSILAGIIEPLISITDTAIIGHVQENPTESLAAVGIVGSFLSALFWILAQTKNAISTIVSQKLGAQKLGEIKSLIIQVLLINLSLGIILVLITNLFASEIFSLYSAKNLILKYSVSYYNISVFGLVFTLITFTLFGIFRGLQNTYWAMNISIVGGLINVILDFILVYGIEGYIPAMHIQGAAWASLTAQFVMMLLAISVFISKTPFKLQLSTKLHSEIPRFLALTGNLIIRTIALNVAIFLSNRYATSYGKHYIATHVILTNIWLFTSFFLDGYADAGNSLAGKLIGQEDYKNLRLLSKKIIKYSLWVALFLSIIFLISYPFIGKIFTNDTETLTVFKQVFWLVILMQSVGAIAFIFDGIYKGLGWVTFLRNMQLIATFAVFIPTLLVFDYFNFRLYAVWIAFLLWMTFRAGSLWWHFDRKLQGLQ
jgi:putative MATE family efflux protein